MNFEGLNTHRLTDNPLELAFAREWHEQNASYDILAWILSKENQKGNPSERDVQIAATVIQWLGSPVGQRFLQNVLNRVK